MTVERLRGRVNGKKEFIDTDTAGLLITVGGDGRELAGPRRREDRPCSAPTSPRRSGTFSRISQGHRVPPAGPRLQTPPEVSEGIIRWAPIAGMTRRITRGNPARRQARQVFIWT